MSGTSGYLKPNSSGGAGLPAPVISLAQNKNGTIGTIAKSFPLTTSGTTSVTPQNRAFVTVHGIPEFIMKNPAKYGLRLELLRYVRRRSNTVAGPAGTGNSTSSRYVHPSNPQIPSGKRTHGGAHSTVSPSSGQQMGVSPAVELIRVVEWPVTNWGQTIDVTQGCHGFMGVSQVQYRDASGGVQPIGLVIPSTNITNNSKMGTRYPYEGKYTPGYFFFRWSIIDHSDRRGGRIHGPYSAPLSLSQARHPFKPEVEWLNPVDGKLYATASIASGFDQNLTRFWIGSVSRLPR